MRDEVAQLCETKEDYLNSARLQYIDHLEGMFHLRTIDKPMKDALTKHLETLLMLNDDPSANVNIISEKIKDIDRIKVYLEELRVKNYFSFWAQQLETHYDPKLVIRRFDNLDSYPKVGLRLNYNEIDFELLIERETNLYFGIAAKPNTNRNETLLPFLNQFLAGFKAESKWYGWII